VSSYCEAAPGHPLHGPYHDCEYGFPICLDAEYFARLVLEINQAGLSWGTILAKRSNFRRAYAGFEIDAVAAFEAADRERLLADAGIIRNRLKVEAAIHNARVLQELRESHGSFHAWLRSHHPLDKADWVRLFRRSFRFTGGEITGEFLMSSGWLPGAHHSACPVQARIEALPRPWDL
jgi:DNA-3-methyladenine glycosylase I